MVPSSGIILIRRGSFVRALRGGARPGVRPYRAHTTPSPGSQPGDTTTTRVCVLFSAPREGALGPRCALTGRTPTPSPGSQPGDTTTPRLCVLFSAPREGAPGPRCAPPGPTP